MRKFFERNKEYRLRLNPQKCTFGVTAKKFLGFLVIDRGIEVDPSKIKAILEMPPPRSEKEIKGFLGSITIHQSIHCQAHLHLRAHLQTPKEE